MNIINQINLVKQTILRAATLYKREANSVHLLAVSKGHSSYDIEQTYNAGLHDFGENYLQEALPKIRTLTALPIHWHFIGPIQSNKTKDIAKNFSWVHSVCREKIAQQLHLARPPELSPLNICIQVNLEGEVTKSGVPPDEALMLAKKIQDYHNLKLRGLMTILPKHQDEEVNYQQFLRLTKLRDSINTELNINMDTLSMGMSDDLHAAIRAGSTILRIGRAIFGKS